MKRRIDIGDMQGRLSEDSLHATQEAGRSLLASPWFYYGVIASVSVWSAFYLVACHG